MSALQKDSPETEAPESKIATILQYRYGDGMVYLPRHQSESLFSQAMQQGYIDREGYVTRKGRALIARYKFL